MTSEKTSPNPLPPAFLERMHQLLGDEFPAFIAGYREDAQNALRVNTLKLAAQELATHAPFALTPLDQPDSFSIDPDARPGLHPYHAAGLYYLQEPSALWVATLMDPQPGELVLDLAAAPGGKATHLSALMSDQGLLVANDVNAKRVWELVGNLERWGARNTIVMQETPARLAAKFGSIFDRVLLDAPCSGEGLLRKRGSIEWSASIVEACARRQTGILDAAAQLTRRGGLLVYSTCTFAPEENEATIARFLAAHPNFEIVKPKWHASFAAGRPDWVSDELARPELSSAVRLWPHRARGEGHFIALLHRVGDAAAAHRPTQHERGDVPRGALDLFHQFCEQHLSINFSTDRLRLINTLLYLLPDTALNTDSLRVIRKGLLLGEVQKGRFKPSHALALALRPEHARQTIDYAASDLQLQDYLCGASLKHDGPNGWVLIAVDGFPLGWGKRTHNEVKNHYPHGLRRPCS